MEIGTVFRTKRQITTSRTKFLKGEKVVYTGDRWIPSTNLHTFTSTDGKGRVLSIPVAQMELYLHEVEGK
jgi:hypothetical protein